MREKDAPVEADRSQVALPLAASIDKSIVPRLPKYRTKSGTPEAAKPPAKIAGEYGELVNPVQKTPGWPNPALLLRKKSPPTSTSLMNVLEPANDCPPVVTAPIWLTDAASSSRVTGLLLEPDSIASPVAWSTIRTVMLV